MNKTILHIDFNSYFATVEQQANPRLRGRPIGVTGGDRSERTVIGAASIEARKFGVKTGMALWQARQLCPEIIFVTGDSDKYLETTKRFLNILKDYSPYVEVFSIDECFLEIPNIVIPSKEIVNGLSTKGIQLKERVRDENATISKLPGQDILLDPRLHGDDVFVDVSLIAQEIKSRIRNEIGEWMRVSVGISYNKLIAKLASNLQKPDGLIIIPDQAAAIEILDRIELDEICGIGSRIKARLFNLGVTNFKQLRQVPLESLLASFKSYGLTLYNMSRGIDERLVLPFYEKEEVKSIGHRLTISQDTNKPEEIKQILLKLTELVARRLRAKNLVGKTVSCLIRYAFASAEDAHHFEGGGMQTTILATDDGLEIFQAAWKIFYQIWDGQSIRMIGVSISNLRPLLPETLSLLPETKLTETINKTLDLVNDKYGEFTLQRGILLQSANIKRMPNPFLSDRRFKL